MSMLELREMSVFYGASQAVKGVSLEVKEHELVTIVGANGAGKTTTLRTISGIYRPRRGTITFEGTDLAALPRKIDVQRMLGVPMKAMTLAEVRADTDAQAAGILANLKKAGIESAGDREIIALIAYLQTLVQSEQPPATTSSTTSAASAAPATITQP